VTDLGIAWRELVYLLLIALGAYHKNITRVCLYMFASRLSAVRRCLFARVCVCLLLGNLFHLDSREFN